MRGKRWRPPQAYSAQRITPAGAGKTQTAGGFRTQEQDHPRRCGENMMPSIFLSASQGSPPQVRGKQNQHNTVGALPGITPAGAGKTPRSQISRTVMEDHPRRCGENRTDCYDVRLRKGSPPQVRGKRLDGFASAPTAGITPAGAGKTKTHQTAFLFARDHPRRCGENNAVKIFFAVTLGSPPQVRGKHAWNQYDYVDERITPAGAGKTFIPSTG